MSHWNYRIVKYKEGGGFGLHEIYYDDDGKATARTLDPVSFSVDSDEGPEGIIKSLKMALKDAKKSPVIKDIF